MNSQLPVAVRTTAAALAVFMTTATLNGMMSIAEPQQSRLVASNAAHRATLKTPASRPVVVAVATIADPDH